jgi:NCAIR mutase (PurE)-related proteins
LRSVRLELRIFPLPRRRRRPQNTSVQTLSVSTMSVWAVSTACCRVSIRFRAPTAL